MRDADLIVIGAGGHAKVVIATALAAGRRVIAVLDDDHRRIGTAFEGFVIQGPIEDALCLIPGGEVILAVGDNQVRARLSNTIQRTFAILVHPFSWVAPDVVLGEGTVVFAGGIVQPATRIGRHCIVNTSASIDHDCVLADFGHVAPGARLAGSVKMGEGAWVGIGACVIQNLELGAWAIVGAGAAVVRSVGDRTLVKGVPARDSDQRVAL